MKQGNRIGLGLVLFAVLLLLLTLGLFSRESGGEGVPEKIVSESRAPVERLGNPRGNAATQSRVRALRQETEQSDFSCPDHRFALAKNAPKPDFMLIGVAKGGSTSFSNYLPTHPLVQDIRTKEPNFWTWKYMDTAKYQSMFVNVVNGIGQGKLIAGEYSTSSILHPLAPKRVHQELPDVKIIVLLRNPIDRAYSHYTMSLRTGLEARSFESVIAKEMYEVDVLRATFRECFNDASCSPSRCFPSSPMHRHDEDGTPFSINSEHDMKDYFFVSYLFRSIYDDSVERWLSLYPREQILFLRSEDLFEDPGAIMEETRRFLQLPEFDFMEQKELQVSWGGGASNRYMQPHSYTPMLPSTRDLLRRFFRPYNQRLYSLIGRDMGWD